MLRIVPFVLAASFVAALVAHAGSSAAQRVVAGSSARGAAIAYSVLYGFRGSKHKDGKNPLSWLTVDKSGALYGSTYSGGTGDCNGGKGCGTIFRLAAAGSGYSETVLHSFSGSDGSYPDGNPITGTGGVLYGAARRGGPSGNGVAYSLAPDGTGYLETNLYAFSGGADGSEPTGPLVAGSHGALFGVTLGGGSTAANCAGAFSQTCGVAYELVPSGSTYAEKVVYAFAGVSDGANPIGGLLAAKGGVLFGVTEGGGTSSSYGTVYELVPSGSAYSERVLYRFQGGSDGERPNGPLTIDRSGTLYGTLQGPSYGAIFTLTPSDSSYRESVVYTFGSFGAGAYPGGSLVVDKAGDIYGTAGGGVNKGHCEDGCGAVYELEHISSTYQFVLLHAFLGNHKGDGGNAYGGLVAAPNGTLFGTTTNGGPGGCGNKGCGSVYSITLPGTARAPRNR
jgi:hypothetical protein